MFEGKNLFEIIAMGGAAMYVLVFCSVLSLGVILERLLTYKRKSRLNKIDFMTAIAAEVQRGNIDKAIKRCEQDLTPIAAVVRAGLKKYGHEEKEISGAMEREIMVETVQLEKFTSIVGTIGNIAVYIGLFGTVLGIIRSFHSI